MSFCILSEKAVLEKNGFFHPYGNVNGGIFLAGDMLSTREVRLDYEESESVRIYRESLLKMKEVCLGQNVQAIYASAMTTSCRCSCSTAILNSAMSSSRERLPVLLLMKVPTRF